MAIVATDWTVDRTTGNIRYTGDDHSGGSPSYATVIQFHRWLQGLADDAVASAASGDELDITNTDPSRRSTDNIITLINGYNITATETEHLYDGSIIQGTAGVDQKIWDGIVNFGNAAVQIQLIQNGAVLSDWWNYNGAGLNPDATAGISHRFMVLVHDYAGSSGDIDNRRIIGTCRRFNYTYSEFVINATSRGNNVLALTDSSDLNNETAAATVAGWTGITNLIEGYNAMDVDNNGTNEYYYSKWDKSTYTINQLYERMKWLSRRSTSEDSCSDTGSDFAVGNATINGQGQSFTVGGNAMYLTRVFAQLKKVGAPTGNLTAKLYLHSGTYGTSSVPLGPIATVASAPTAGGTGYTVNDVLNVSEGTGGQVTATTVTGGVVEAVTFTTAGTGYTTGTGKATTGGTGSGCTINITGLTAQATSANIDVSKLTTTYQTIEIGFDTQFKMTASTYYVITFEYTDGGASNYVHVKGLATTGTHSGNRVQKNGAWAATAADDLNFNCFTSPGLYGISGERFRGITHQVAYSTLTGTFDDSNPVSWSGASVGTGQIIADNGTDMMWIQLLTGVSPVSTASLSQTVPDVASATAGTVTGRTISKPYCGASTGSAIIGAYGFGIETADLTAQDKVTSLADVVMTPPNNVQNIVGGLSYSGDPDRVFVVPWDGTSYDSNGDPAIDKDQLSLSTSLTTDNITSVVIVEAIPADTPPSGYIRVTDDNGFERRLHYSEYNTGTKTFTIDTTDGNEDFLSVNATSGNDIYVAYLDNTATAATMSYTSVQSGSRNLVVIVRNGGSAPIKQFISAWSQSTSPQTITAIRTTDA